MGGGKIEAEKPQNCEGARACERELVQAAERWMKCVAGKEFESERV